MGILWDHIKRVENFRSTVIVVHISSSKSGLKPRINLRSPDLLSFEKNLEKPQISSSTKPYVAH
jgi:hypothetical protein